MHFTSILHGLDPLAMGLWQNKDVQVPLLEARGKNTDMEEKQ